MCGMYQVVGYIVLGAAVAAACTIMSTILVLPSYAVDELRSKVADALIGVGQKVSR